jgi:hypothetical protein
MPKLASIGGYLAAGVLIVFGVAVIAIGFVGRGYTRDQLAQEQIVGSPDMTPKQISAGVKEAGLTDVSIPSCSVAGEKVDTGQEARCFASYMRIHTLEATGGKTYAQMPQYATADGKGTNDPAKASKGPDGSPQSNEARNIWVTETALTTALNTSFFAEAVALFAIIIGVAMVLIGVGFLVLTVVARRRATGADTAVPAPPAPVTAPAA